MAMVTHTMAAAVIADGGGRMPSLVDACLYLPLGVALAVLVLEVFSGGSKNAEVDKGNVVLLVFASVLFFLGGFLVFSRAESVGRELAVRASGGGVLLGIACAVAAMLKQQCYLQKLLVSAKARTRRSAGGQPAVIWPTFYLVVLLGVLIAGGRVAWIRPDRALLAESGEMAEVTPPAGDDDASLEKPPAEGESPPVQAIVMRDDSPELKREREPEFTFAPTRDGGRSDSFPGAMESGLGDDASKEGGGERGMEAPGDRDGSGTGDDPTEMEEDEDTRGMDVAESIEPDGAASPSSTEKEAGTVTVSLSANTAAAHRLDPAAVRVFTGSVMPMMKDRCVSCHGAEKQKGDLRLDSPSWIRKGGKSGPVFVVFQPERSALYTSTTLPEDDPDIMPAKGKPLTTAQTSALRRWILGGAPMGDGEDREAAAAALAAMRQRGGGGAAGGGLNASLSGSIGEALTEAHIHHKALADGLLEVDCSLTRNYPETPLDLTVLAPIADKIHTLDLSKTKVRDADLKVLTGMENLNRLMLNRTSVGDEGMAHLSGLKQLETINLYGTNVSDEGLKHLKDLGNLKKLYLWNSKATSRGGDFLRQANPDLEVNVGQ